jgi:hypothetical protein
MWKQSDDAAKPVALVLAKCKPQLDFIVAVGVEWQ